MPRLITTVPFLAARVFPGSKPWTHYSWHLSFSMFPWLDGLLHLKSKMCLGPGLPVRRWLSPSLDKALCLGCGWARPVCRGLASTGAQQFPHCLPFSLLPSRFNWSHLTPPRLQRRFLGLGTASTTKGRAHFTLEGHKFLIFGGSIHYFRVPREYWRDRLLKLKACGFNTVTT